ncbi:hypothetical protein V5O48_013022 [Marasmius crinis-equi]|uniref:Alpha/beta hydrolase fold-3 domain-containing protein n=1 Tax=Marasmius crinis-equi TaxID=585013 RepID=A0ABR3F188_9AGAR
MAEFAHLSEVDPEIAPHLEALRASTMRPDVPIDKVREALKAGVMETVKAKYQPLLPTESDYTIADHSIEVGDGVKALSRIVTPAPRDGEDGTFPVLFWMHGGGFALGDVNTDDYRLRIASVRLRLSIVNFEYRLAPENPFPAAVDDAFAGLKYVASHPETFSASLHKGFLVGGTSAGANLAAVLSHLARDDPFFDDKPLTGQLLHIPSVIHYQAPVPEKYKSSLLSLEQNKDAPLLGKAQIIHFMEMYKATPTDTRSSPLLLDSHKGLPPAYLQICGLDPLRDGGLLYRKVLGEAGVPTKLDVYPGVPHNFESRFFDIKQAVKSREDFHVGLEWLLRGEKDVQVKDL